jgi:hypothetical protein
LRNNPGDVAEWLRSGLQSRLHRFDSGRRLLELLHIRCRNAEQMRLVNPLCLFVEMAEAG